jgi:membrane-bound lytic murein transglycosylase A
MAQHRMRSSHCRSAAGALLLALTTGCTVAPAPPGPSPVVPPATAIATEPQARYVAVAFEALPSISDRDWVAAWPALLQSCRALAKVDAWKTACTRAQPISGRNAQEVRGYFAEQFDAYRIEAAGAEGVARAATADAGLVTGYYEPVLKGSRRPNDRYTVPLYRVPDDLVVVDLAMLYPELTGLRLRGRMQGRRLVPYLARSEISRSKALAGQELLWVEDAIEAFFLQVQGSGRVRFDDGTTVRVAFAEHNGHPYRSIGRWLVDQGELTADQVSMQGIKAWAARNPQHVQTLLDHNPSFVFFRELPLGDPQAGASGSLGVPLTPGASVAADPRFVPIGAPLVLALHPASTATATVRPVLAQDTGTAIRGPLRFDLYWGVGAEAGERAGRQRQQVDAWLLTPRGVAPSALLKR